MARPCRLLPLAAWGLLLAAVPAAAADESPLLSRLVHAYAGVHTLSAGFTQETTFPGFPKPRTYRGTLDLARPDRMRWDYTEGSAQQVYVNGRTVTVYMPEARQAVESTLTPASDRQVPLSLLADVTRIDRTYDVAAGLDPQELVLTPKAPDPAAPEAVHLWLDPNTDLIARVRLLLPGGSRSDITFADVKANPAIDPARFEVVLPPGITRVRADTLFPGGRR